MRAIAEMVGRRWTAGLLLMAAASLLASCGSARHREPIAEPLQHESAKVARGERVFMGYCYKCHPGGEGGIGFAINNKPLPGPMIKAQVRAGVGAMPSFSKELLPDDKLDDLVAYLQTLRKQ